MRISLVQAFVDLCDTDVPYLAGRLIWRMGSGRLSRKQLGIPVGASVRIVAGISMGIHGEILECRSQIRPVLNSRSGLWVVVSTRWRLMSRGRLPHQLAGKVQPRWPVACSHQH